MALLLAACGGAPSAPRMERDTITVHAAMAPADEFKPTYDKTELARVLADEHKAIAAAETRAADEDVAFQQDLGVRRRFVASLEVCAANARICPPRLDEPPWTYDIETEADPPLESPLRFDLASWQKIASELHGRACACRTLTCVETLGVAIDRLEKRPMPDVLDDDAAAVSIVRARECLSRLRGKIKTPQPAATE